MSRIKQFIISALTVVACVIGAGVLFAGCIFRTPVEGPTAAPVWTANVGASAQPKVVDGVVYVLGSSQDGPDHVFAFDGATGKQLWVTDFDAAQLLVVKNNQALIRDKDDFVRTLDARTGSQLEQTKIANDWIAFLWADDAFYGVNNRGELCALGKQGWRAKTPYTTVYGNPQLDGGLVYLYGRHYVNDGAGENGQPYTPDAPPRLNIITAYDAKTGELRWKRQGCPGCVISTPLVSDGVIYFTEEEERSRSGSRDSGNANSDAEQQSRYKVNYTLHAFDVAAKKDLWTQQTNDQVTQVGSPQFIDGDVLYITEAPGSADHYRALNIKTGESLWQMQSETKSLKAAAFAGGVIYVTGRRAHALLNTGGDTSPDSWLSAIDGHTGRQLWHSDVKDLSEFTAPVAANGMIYVASMPFFWNGEQKGGEYALYAFRASRDGK